MRVVKDGRGRPGAAGEAIALGSAPENNEPVTLSAEVGLRPPQTWAIL